MENEKRNGGKGPKPVPAAIRMHRHILVDEVTGCWMWQGSCNNAGYPQMKDMESKRPKFVHRLSYEIANGPIPQGMVIDHLCYSSEGISNRKCVNPNHLEAVTPSVNSQRQQDKRVELGIKHPLTNRTPWNKGKKMDPETKRYT